MIWIIQLREPTYRYEASGPPRTLACRSSPTLSQQRYVNCRSGTTWPPLHADLQMGSSCECSKTLPQLSCQCCCPLLSANGSMGPACATVSTARCLLAKLPHGPLDQVQVSGERCAGISVVGPHTIPKGIERDAGSLSQGRYLGVGATWPIIGCGRLSMRGSGKKTCASWYATDLYSPHSAYLSGI